MSEIFEKLRPYMEKAMAYQAALTLFEWDQETLAPMGAEELTSKVVGELSDSYMQALVNEEVEKYLKKVSSGKEWEKLSFLEQDMVTEWKRLYAQLECIPKEEYKAYTTLTSRAPGIWSRAKENDNFAEFMPTLEKIVEYKRKFVKYRKKASKEFAGLSDYDVLLDEYEPGFTVEVLDEFFEQIKEELVPFLKEITEKCKKVDKSYNYKTYPSEKQEEFCRWISGYMGFDYNRGVVAQSAHPFTTNLHNHDVRITNHYYEDNLESAIFSAIHETGHALYEMGVADELSLTMLETGTSMGMHESQSRFWENVMGRSQEFWKPCYEKLQKTFPEQLQDVSLEQFILGVNKIEPGLIRTEADELSYSLHILVRYELEKQLIEGTLQVKDLENAWADAYEEYLGIRPKQAAKGVLQDIHWACGDFGYFPSYAIGTAVAAQIYYHLKKTMDLEQYLKDGNLTPIREYLKEHIYQYGKQKDTNTLLKEMTGEEFKADYYIQYLKEKYTKLYA